MGGKNDTQKTFDQVEQDLLRQLYINARLLLEPGTVSLLLRSQVFSTSSTLSSNRQFLIGPPSTTLTLFQSRLRARGSGRDTVTNSTGN